MSAVPANLSGKADAIVHDVLPADVTPAFIYDEGILRSTLECYSKLRSQSGCKVLYSLKAFANPYILQQIAPALDGFSVSSVNEAMIARQVDVKGDVHFTSPGLKLGDMETLRAICNYISFNSLSQWRRCFGHVDSSTRVGLRVNPQLSVVSDLRYDPCRVYSKLGIPIKHLVKEYNGGSDDFRSVSGIHFHTNSESDTIEPLLSTVKHIERFGNGVLRNIKWINLGGGYLFDKIVSLDPFYEVVDILRNKYELNVFIEPGQGIIGQAGSLVSSVVDLFRNGGKTIAVLDTTVNHMPEVFEYQYRPTVRDDSCNGKFKYLLAGSSCLAGDLFGHHRFNKPLTVGSQIIFEGVGAYTLVKAHMFNGIDLPRIAALTENGEIVFLNGLHDYVSKSKRSA